MRESGCTHDTHLNDPSHDKNCYTDLNFCLNCIPCFSCGNYPSIGAIRSLEYDKSFLCLGCYANMICTIFEWNYFKIPNEGIDSVIEDVKQYKDRIDPQRAKFLLMDIAGTLLESPFVEGKDTPTSSDLNTLEELDSIISWNSRTELVSAGPKDFLRRKFSESLNGWNNFLNMNRGIEIIVGYEENPKKLLEDAEARILKLQQL